MGRTIEHFRQLGRVARKEGVMSALKYDAQETLGDLGEIADEVFFGGPMRALTTLGLALAIPTFILGTTIKAGIDAVTYGFGETQKTAIATYVDRARMPTDPYGGEVDIGTFRLDNGREIYLNDLQRPLDGKFLSSWSIRGLEQGQRYVITTVGFGDVENDTFLRAERVQTP